MTAAFTLAELIMVSGLSLVVATIALGVTKISSQALFAIHGQGLVQMQLNTAMGTLSQDVRLATSAASGLAGTVTTLTLTVPSIDASGAVIPWTSDTFRYDYDSATGNLQRTITPNAASSRTSQVFVVARGFTLVTFTPTANAVTIALGARRTEGNYAFDGNLSTQVAFRNI